MKGGLSPHRLFATVLCGCVLYIRHGVAVVIKLDSVTMLPLVVEEEAVVNIVFNASNVDGVGAFVKLKFETDDPDIARIEGEDIQPISRNVTIRVRGIFLGGTYVKIYVNSSLLTSSNATCVSKGDNFLMLDWCELAGKYEVAVSRKKRPVDIAFIVVIICLVVIANIAMGCQVDLVVVKDTMKRPIAPLTGFASQFIIMPVASFLFAYFMDFKPSIALGFFAIGCSPGGSASNIYAYLLGGDVSLSVTMTIISTVASLAMLPLWMFTLGTHVLVKGTRLKIPFTQIFTSLVGLVLPIFIGIILKYKKPDWAKHVVKLIRPVALIFLLFMFTVGVYANLYIFSLLRPLVLAVGCLLPYCGFFLGAVVALAFRQPRKNIITIAIETGIQNTGITIVLLKLSLESPARDLSIVAPVAVALFTPIPLVLGIIYVEVRKRCFSSHPDQQTKTIEDEDADIMSDFKNMGGDKVGCEDDKNDKYIKLVSLTEST